MTAVHPLLWRKNCELVYAIQYSLWENINCDGGRLPTRWQEMSESEAADDVITREIPIRLSCKQRNILPHASAIAMRDERELANELEVAFGQNGE